MPLAAVAAIAIVAALLVSSGTAARSPQAAQKTVKAGLVSDVGRFNDKGFNQLQLIGLNRAKKQLKVTTRAIESRAANEYLPNFVSLARAKYDIIIGAGFLLADDEEKVAQQFPDVHFAITDYDVKGAPFNGQKNVEGLTYATQQNSYLVGCLAGLMVKRAGGSQMIGVVGGVKIPPVDTFLAGYQAGAAKCNPGIKVLVGYSQDFIDQAKCKTVAENQIAAGSQVEFNVAGPCGLGTLNAAKEHSIWGIGVDTDQAFLGSHILTSAVKRVDNGIYNTVKLVQQGKFQGGKNLVFTLKNGGVGLGKISAKVPKAYVTRINTLKKQIIAGKIKPPTVVQGG